MLAIIISACLATDPANCKDYRIPLDASVDPTKCVMHAPPHVAKWADEPHHRKRYLAPANAQRLAQHSMRQPFAARRITR
jgi:hypothetical protein